MLTNTYDKHNIFIWPCGSPKLCIVSALLGDMDWTKESIMLQRNLALGDAKHRRLVQNMYEDVRQGDLRCSQFLCILSPLVLLLLIIF